MKKTMRLAELAGVRPSKAALACHDRLAKSGPDDYVQAAVLLVDDWRRRGVSRVGLGGGQGAGKSTLGRLLASAGKLLGLRLAVLGIDDFYLTRAERQKLAANVHPLLATRGPPGTHAIGLARQAFEGLLRNGAEVQVPRFDKGVDDRVGTTTIRGGADIVVLEGWCVGASPATADESVAPLNDLERDEDPEGVWRRHVNAALREEYAPLFGTFDALAFLQVPDLDAVRRWRLQQERERPPEQRMGAAGVARFVQHYERITRRMLATLPARADAVLRLDDAHRVAELRLRR